MTYNAEREQKRRQKNIDKAYFRCDLCDKNFGRARDLKRHLAGKHHLSRQRRQDANGRPYPCRFCDYRAKKNPIWISMKNPNISRLDPLLVRIANKPFQDKPPSRII